MNTLHEQEPRQLLKSVIAASYEGDALELCLTCGQCVSRCFLIDGYPELNPRKLIRQVILGMDDAAAESEFIWACTLCGRCTTDCPKDLKMDVIIRKLRAESCRRGLGPARIIEGIEKALEVGNNTGMEPEEFVDTAQWLVEELEDEFEGAGDLEVPFDKENAELLYIPNPREYTSNPGMFQTYVKFFHLIDADWTLSSKVFDITNWAYYVGDQDAAVTLVRNMVEETRRLGAKILLSTECGHGFKILRKDAERWLGEPLGFEVMGVIELAHKYWREGRLPIKPGAIEGPVTYHDPCNVGRKMGIFEEPRELIQAVCDNFIEMWPNRKYSLCCGGGGSVGQNTAMGVKRLEHARRKHDQIMNTGAKILATCCQNCLSQLTDLKDRYEMPIEVKSVIELLVESMESRIGKDE
ncbi:MAG: (Fe-S)-binding protein [Desulfomonilaceae bacterium]